MHASIICFSLPAQGAMSFVLRDSGAFCTTNVTTKCAKIQIVILFCDLFCEVIVWQKIFRWCLQTDALLFSADGAYLQLEPSLMYVKDDSQARLAAQIAGYRLREAELLFENGQAGNADRLLRTVLRKNPRYAGACWHTTLVRPGRALGLASRTCSGFFHIRNDTASAALGLGGHAELSVHM